MFTRNKVLLFVAVIILVLGIGTAFLSNRKLGSSSLNTSTGSPSVHTIEISPGVFAEVEDRSDSATSSPQYLNPAVSRPNLNRPISIPNGFNEKLAASVTKKIADITTALKTDPSNYDSWTDLGIYRKAIEDYAGAEEIWLYETKAAPRGPDAYINLGDLYMYYFHDNAKAEAMFKTAVSIAPRSVEAYSRLVDYYVTALHDKSAAKAMLEAAIKKYPDMENSLHELLLSVS